MTQFQYYPARINSRRFVGYVTLDYFLKAHKHPKEKTKSIFKMIEIAEKIGDNEAKADLKQNNLFYFTPCVTVSKNRCYKEIISFTGLAVLDFDHIDNAEEFKKHIFNTYNYIIAAWLSPSKRGVKAFINIPVVKDVAEFKDYYRAIEKVFEVFDGWDGTNKNAVLPLFQSYDADLLHRRDAALFKDKLLEPKPSYQDPVKVAMPRNADNKEKLIYAIADSSISKITAPGHPQLRSACIALGGYVASGYIDKYAIISHVDKLIECNGYLKKGVKGYQQTARWSIDEGLKNPIIL
jgi:hypothetical protein